MNRNERIEKLVPTLLPWYAEYGRKLPWREDPTPYHVWVSEIMLQQTRIEAVRPYYSRFLQELPDIAALADADPEHLMKLWEGLGYYSRARNLQAAAKQIVEKHDGKFPETYEQIRRLSGIGDYTAGAIASICFDLPAPAVDGNVLRVISRITGDERPVTDEKTRASVRSDLAAVYPENSCGDFTQALMELGETVCLPNGVPGCMHCPCRDFCVSADGDWVHFPVKPAKKERRKEQLTVFLLKYGDYTAVRKRAETGLLSGMWEFPNVTGALTEDEAYRQAEEWNCMPAEVRKERSRTHIFTHIEWDMRCYSVLCRNMPDEFTWSDKEDFRERISLPTAFRKFL